MATFDPATFDSAAFDAGSSASETGSAVLPIIIRVGPVGSAALPLEIYTLPTSLLTGAASVCIGQGNQGAVWTAIVRINALDVSSHVLGEITVDAEEGAAAIAEITLRPPSGTVVDLTSWTGLPVTIDVADKRTGVARYPARLFTGVVDTPRLNHAARTISLSCTDDLQGIVAGMSNTELTALINGRSSPVVFDAAATGWTFAQNLLSTVAASLDVSPDGTLCVTSWTAKPVADILLDDLLLGDGSIAVDVADRAGLTNEVLIDFAYRFPRLKAEGHDVAYRSVDMTNFAQYLLDDNWFMQRAQVEAAISHAGGTIEQITYTPLPDEVIVVGAGVFTPSAADADLCMGFAAVVSFDYAQTIEEQHQILVRNARSVDRVGLRRESMSGALEGAYPDLVATETSIRAFKFEMSSTPPTNMATVLPGYTTSVDGTLTTDTNRAAADAAMETLIDQAKTRIRATHRRNQVSATVPLIPIIARDKTLRLEGDGVIAHGKCVRVLHRLNHDTGQATTDCAVALCSVAGVGITHDEDATEASDGTTSSTTAISTETTVVFNSGPDDDHEITITFPEVDADERNNNIVEIPSEIAAALVEDVFTVVL